MRKDDSYGKVIKDIFERLVGSHYIVVGDGEIHHRKYEDALKDPNDRIYGDRRLDGTELS